MLGLKKKKRFDRNAFCVVWLALCKYKLASISVRFDNNYTGVSCEIM